MISKKYHKKRLCGGALLFIILFLFNGCQSALASSVKSIQNTIVQEKQENLSITVYYLPPEISTRAPLTLEQLIHFDADCLNIMRFCGDVVEETKQILLNKLDAALLVKSEPTNKTNARIYYVMEDKAGNKILEMIVYAGDNTLYFNGIEIEYSPIIYEILLPCFKDNEDVLKGYFGQYN